MVAKKPRTEKRKSYQSFVFQQATAKHLRNRETQNSQARMNIQRRHEGKPTPWEEAKERRLARRAAARAAQATGGTH
jgi:hypothetical protein